MASPLRRRSRLSIEALEERAVPAVSILFSGGSLSVTGDNLANNLTVKATANNQVQVLNGVGAGPQINLGTYALTGALRVQMGNSADTVTLDLAGQTLSGVGLTVNVGNGADSVTLDGISAGGGTIGGSASINLGFGNDTFRLGSRSGIHVGGSVFVDGGLGTDLVDIGDSANLALSTVGSDLFITRAANVTLGFNGVTGTNSKLTVGRDVLINNSTLGAVPETFNNFAPNSIGRNLTFVGAAGNTTFVNNAFVAGNTFVKTGNGNDLIAFGTFFGTSLNGGLTVLSGGGNDFVEFFGAGAFSLGGDLNVLLGDGADNLVAGVPTTVGGNMTVTAGNGGLPLNMNNFSVNGNLTATVGNGNNSFTLNQNGTTDVGGNVSYTSGSGNDSVTLGGSISGAVNLYLGSGANGVTFIPGLTMGSATLDFGVGSAGDTFNDNGVIVTWPQVVRNFTP